MIVQPVVEPMDQFAALVLSRSAEESVYLRTCEISLNLSPASGFLSG